MRFIYDVYLTGVIVVVVVVVLGAGVASLVVLFLFSIFPLSS